MARHQRTPSLMRPFFQLALRCFPNIVENYGDLAEKENIIGRDGIARIRYRIPGWYGGKDGVFEFMVESDGITVNHRFLFPKPLLLSALSLLPFHIAEVAWRYEDALDVIDFYAQEKYIILGGDVYEDDNGTIIPTSDSWFITSEDTNKLDAVELSAKKHLII
jgi:hypothetical protein